jgi:hypothetical protein
MMKIKGFFIDLFDNSVDYRPAKGWLASLAKRSAFCGF